MPLRRIHRTLHCALLAGLLAGCATRTAEGPPPEAVSAADFAGWPCDALADEIERVQQRAADVAYAVDPLVGDNNVIVLSSGSRVFWPALLAMRPDGPDAAELGRLKARFEALNAAAKARTCPAPGEASSRAAALPVSPGERLVYEERLGSGGPAQEIGLRLLALKRGELDFAVDRGAGGTPLPWRQDAAGNAIGLHPYRMLGWSHLLRRNLALGDVLSGELQGPETAGRTAVIRGQVVAVGPQEVGGHHFDTATIELFGDVPDGPDGPGATRVDGVMVVDRASGVLLRLELRSGNPEFAVRRKLVRIDPVS